ncbi:MAG: Sucrose-6-phosphate hydrolase [Candidatus Celerinatantimonas neptuna]|nr:MAG: Sucrose-6-phosphate hydrolase [Candidatus Celerinatantimonas neptuna]
MNQPFNQHFAVNTPWFPFFHIAPPYGLMNDPNGFCQYKGQYWLFFQWNPTGCAHKNKHWGLLTSNDLVHWQQQKFTFAPEHWYDKDGCYSGTALVRDDELSVFYTGNVRHGEKRESYQCLVTTRDGQSFEHHGPLWPEQLEGFTGHVRDPKVFESNGKRFMWLAAQSDKLLGGVAVLEEQSSGDWSLCGHFNRSIGWANDQYGYMWECPDYLEFSEQNVLVCCVQGIETGLSDYHNRHLSGYFNVAFNSQNGHIEFQSDYRLLDHGFEFYAPQSIKNEQGEIFLIGWMGLPEAEPQPTVEQYGWTEQLTIPRHCEWRDGYIYQTPSHELDAAFDAASYYQLTDSQSQFDIGPQSRTHWKPAESSGQLVLGEGVEQLSIAWNQQGSIIVDRGALAGSGADTRRHYKSRLGQIESLTLFLDSSSFELFVNDGEAVLSGRIFPTTPLILGHLSFEQGAEVSVMEVQVRLLGQRVINLLSKEAFDE